MDETRAAIFDFDGVIFHKNAKWKISDVRFGISGSRISFQEALADFKEYKKEKPNSLLTDCFTLDEFKYEALDAEAINFTPPEIVAQTAQNHVFKGHELYFLSFCKHRELSIITDQIIGKLRYPVIKNPFGVAHHLFPDSDYYEGIEDEKFTLLLSLLQKKDEFISRNIKEKKIFTRLYYYYTDTNFADQLREYLKNNFENLEGGRNSITFSYIAGSTKKNQPRG